MSLLEIYALLLAIGLVLAFMVVIVIMRTVASINKKLDQLIENTSAPDTEKIPVVENYKQSSLAKKKVCSVCETTNREDAKFCDKCGHKM